MTTRRLILLRHGETSYNAGSRIQGQLEVELNQHGVEQAVAAAELLSERKPALILSSDLGRAALTAQKLADRVGLSVHHDERLRETHLGEWQGLTHTEVEAQWPGGLDRWRTEAEWAPPGGETRVQVAERGVAVVREIDRQGWMDRPIVLVAHGGLINAVTASLLELARARWSMLGGVRNTRWAELSCHGSGATELWRLEAWNAGAP